MLLLSKASLKKLLDERDDEHQQELLAQIDKQERSRLQSEIDSLKEENKRLHDRNIQLSIWRKQVEQEALSAGFTVELKPPVKEHWVFRKR